MRMEMRIEQVSSKLSCLFFIIQERDEKEKKMKAWSARETEEYLLLVSLIYV